MSEAAFAERVLSHLVGPNEARAIGDLRRYLEAFTGRLFERLSDTDPFALTANDLVAVTSLSVSVSPESAADILGQRRAEIEALLRQVPADATILEPGRLLERGEAAWNLYDLLLSMHGLGSTTVSKLLAAKRPALIPIRDSVVAAALGDPERWWESWRDFMSGDGAEERINAVRHVAAEADARHLSLLRVLDVVIWMHHRHPAGSAQRE